MWLAHENGPPEQIRPSRSLVEVAVAISRNSISDLARVDYGDGLGYFPGGGGPGPAKLWRVTPRFRSSPREDLFVAKVLIGRDDHLVALAFRQVEQCPVVLVRPAFSCKRVRGVLRKAARRGTGVPWSNKSCNAPAPAESSGDARTGHVPLTARTTTAGCRQVQLPCRSLGTAAEKPDWTAGEDEHAIRSARTSTSGAGSASAEAGGALFALVMDLRFAVRNQEVRRSLTCRNQHLA